jgi:glycyl-tRNA synthetase beta chain
MDGVEDKFKADRAELENEILQFFRDRLFHFVRGEGVKSEIADAVLAMRFGRVPETMARLKAVSEFAAREEFEPFAVAFKRAGNIVKDYPEPGEVDPALFEEDAEKALHQAVESVRDRVEKLVGAGDVLGALLTVAEIRPTVDRFFDDVWSCTKETVRVNRLNLVSSVVRLFAASRISSDSKLFYFLVVRSSAPMSSPRLAGGIGFEIEEDFRIVAPG